MAAAHVAAHVDLMDLVRPSRDTLWSYREALERGWSSEQARDDAEAAAAELAKVDEDPTTFIANLNDRMGGGHPVILPNGDAVPRIPGTRRWMWDGEYCGAIGLRWQPDTMDLPPHCLGHIGYAVVPWKRRNGYATDALQQMLDVARAKRLPYVDIVTDADNTASQAVAVSNGARLVRPFTSPESSGSFPALLFRIDLG
jgi:predicted acetyltransferase